MKAGAAISGAAHAALIAVVILGVPWFSPRDRPPVPVTDVSFVSEAEFDRAQAASQAPREETAPPEQPAEVPPPPAARPPEPEPEPEAPPEAPAPEPLEQVATLAPTFDPEAPLAAPALELAPPQASQDAPARMATVAPPRARPRIPVASTPAPPPPETARPAEAPAPQPEPSPEPEPQPEKPVEAPPEAAPETAAEEPAETEPEAPGTLALASSAPPVPRRGNMETPAAPPRVSELVKALREEVAREQARQAGATPPTPATEPTVSAPTPPSTDAATSLPEGPPITNAERDGLRLAVQRCWVVPAGVRDASELKVVLAAALEPDGAVISGSIRLIEPDPAPDARFQAAYDAGRRALIRCAPYADLPREKYARWRNIEVVFNPEGMVSW